MGNSGYFARSAAGRCSSLTISFMIHSQRSVARARLAFGVAAGSMSTEPAGSKYVAPLSSEARKAHSLGFRSLAFLP